MKIRKVRLAAIRELTGRDLRGLDEILIVVDGKTDTHLAAIIPYTEYLRMQQGFIEAYQLLRSLEEAASLPASVPPVNTYNP